MLLCCRICNWKDISKKDLDIRPIFVHGVNSKLHAIFIQSLIYNLQMDINTHKYLIRIDLS